MAMVVFWSKQFRLLLHVDTAVIPYGSAVNSPGLYGTLPLPSLQPDCGNHSWMVGIYSPIDSVHIVRKDLAI